jgi:hypothetical protein
MYSRLNVKSRLVRRIRRNILSRHRRRSQSASHLPRRGTSGHPYDAGLTRCEEPLAILQANALTLKRRLENQLHLRCAFQQRVQLLDFSLRHNPPPGGRRCTSWKIIQKPARFADGETRIASQENDSNPPENRSVVLPPFRRAWRCRQQSRLLVVAQRGGSQTHLPSHFADRHGSAHCVSS